MPCFRVQQNKRSYVRFYRNYSIADFSFWAFTFIFVTYAAYRGPARVRACEKLSHHPELMRDMLERGLNLENCERWLKRTVFDVLVVLFLIIVLRVSPSSYYYTMVMVIKFFAIQLHFLLAVSSYYSHFTRHYRRGPASYASFNSIPSHAMQRIFLLPEKITDPANLEHDVDLDVVYAPVPRHSVPKELQDQAIEAWVPRRNQTSQSSFHSSELRNHHQRRHRHHGSRYRSGSPSSQTGAIKLELTPDGGLFPGYVTVDGSVVDRDQKMC